MSNAATTNFVTQFTLREEALLSRVRGRIELPDQLRDWDVWIKEPSVYLQHLREFVENYEERYGTTHHTKQ